MNNTDLQRSRPQAALARLLPTIYPWVQAFIWAFKPTEVVDVRRFPREEALAINENIARLGRARPRRRSPRRRRKETRRRPPVTEAEAPP
jgi:hypothetical protein